MYRPSFSFERLSAQFRFSSFEFRSSSSSQAVGATEEREEAEVAEDLEERSFTRRLVQDGYPRRIVSCWRILGRMWASRCSEYLKIGACAP